MKKRLLYPTIVLLAIIASIISCKKNNNIEHSFTASVAGNAFSFDSLFAWIDTSSVSAGVVWVHVGAKNTRNQNGIYLIGMAFPGSNINGTYYYNIAQPYPDVQSYKYLHGFSIILATGPNKGFFYLTDNTSSSMSVSSVSGSVITGKFALALHPSLAGGRPDSSITLSATGDFILPLRYIP